MHTKRTKCDHVKMSEASVWPPSIQRRKAVAAAARFDSAVKCATQAHNLGSYHVFMQQTKEPYAKHPTSMAADSNHHKACLGVAPGQLWQ